MKLTRLFNFSEKRLARLLLLMANFGKEGKPEPVIRKLGFIEYNGQLKVHNSLLNVILHDAPGLRREAEDA